MAINLSGVLLRRLVQVGFTFGLPGLGLVNFDRYGMENGLRVGDPGSSAMGGMGIGPPPIHGDPDPSDVMVYAYEEQFCVEREKKKYGTIASWRKSRCL
jgi:hypothetical protein